MQADADLFRGSLEEFPQIVARRNGGDDSQRLLANGMDERHPTRMQRDAAAVAAAVGITPFCAVLQVAFDGCSLLRELCAYLMMSPCKQVNLIEIVVGAAREHTVFEPRLLALFRGLGRGSTSSTEV